MSVSNAQRLVTKQDLKDFYDGILPYLGGCPTTTLSQTLSAGSTSVTFANVPATSGSIVEVGTSKAGLEYNDITVSGSSYTVTFDAQSSAVTVYLVITEV